MLNEDKVILMTKMASYEEREGKKNMRVNRFFRSDYIAVRILETILCVTIAYVFVLALYVAYHFEELMQDIYKLDLVDMARKAAMYYLVLVAVYAAVTYVVYTYRYVRARKNLKLYYKNLKKLNSMYNED